MAESASNKTIEVKARLGDLRISPRKTRLVTDMVKKKSVEEARDQLRLFSKKAARPILKLINSAVANAEHNFKLNPEKLVIKNLIVNQGQVMKRYKPRAQGRVSPVKHRTSIVEVTLVENAKLKPRRKLKAQAVPEKKKVEQKSSEKTDSQKKQDEPKDITKGPIGKDQNNSKLKKGLVDMKKRLFNRKTNA